MKKKRLITVIFLMTMIGVSLSACSDFLNVVPKDRLTGNNFYKDKNDVEANLVSIYSKFFEKINQTHVIGSIGEYRSGEVMASEQHFRYNQEGRMVEALGRNDLLDAINNGAWRDHYHLWDITNWTGYFQVIQGTNILIEKLEEGIPNLTDAETRRYIAEATFIRCFTYFWMVRLYGDVPYYTNAYQSDPLGREPMVEVINKCIEDMKSRMNDLPWTYTDPSLKGARGSRGSAVALLMHMNMWNAGFDGGNRTQHYTETAELGQALINSQAYRLLPLEQWELVVKGKSDESLFEFFRSINYGDNVNLIAPVANNFLRWPYKNPRYDHQVSLTYYTTEYMTKIFPENDADQRKETIDNNGWFGDVYGGGVYSGDGEFLLAKFAHNIPDAGNENINPDNTFLIFRYSDAILLRAEALAELGRDQEASEMVNMVRNRAKATPYSGPGGDHLKDYIYLERCRELIGEGHRYFDLIRTGRIMNSQWARRTLNRDQYNRRAWTWPIDRSALNNNPKMTLNEYWETIGN
ncbi:RagB/SusD family nutrient uptake outer membrane protein [Albibacterium indicum]|uniref:RagB/SusD family nutrient uptake outer membrane protein n=1 Tax=Albibacterium indicum TaxID=2292082 RepID=UPI000E4AB915|nr:RagB/SusD family nutrient uptake outer membrane protein [Pedobacter indicus]